MVGVSFGMDLVKQHTQFHHIKVAIEPVIPYPEIRAKVVPVKPVPISKIVPSTFVQTCQEGGTSGK